MNPAGVSIRNTSQVFAIGIRSGICFKIPQHDLNKKNERKDGSKNGKIFVTITGFHNTILSFVMLEIFPSKHFPKRELKRKKKKKKEKTLDINII